MKHLSQLANLRLRSKQIPINVPHTFLLLHILLVAARPYSVVRVTVVYIKMLNINNLYNCCPDLSKCDSDQLRNSLNDWLLPSQHTILDSIETLLRKKYNRRFRLIIFRFVFSKGIWRDQSLGDTPQIQKHSHKP